jgi:hypothetical protein
MMESRFALFPLVQRERLHFWLGAALVKKLFALIFLVMATVFANAQSDGSVQGFCTVGGQTVKVSGMNSTTYVQASYPKCLVTVYQSGTSTLATIYKDANETPLSNPFTANVDASWIFWAKNGGALDITLSGGTPTPFPQPFTIVATFPSNAGGGGGGSPPAGIPQEIQTNANNTQFGASKIFSDGTTYAYTPLSQYAQYSRNNPLLSYCGHQCGDVRIYGQDAPVINSQGVASGYGQAFFNYRKGLYTSLSGYVGPSLDANDPAGGSVFKLQNDTVAFHSTSISQLYNLTTTAGKMGDTANIYSYLNCHGGYWYPADEGCTNVRANGGLDHNLIGAFYLSGSAGVGATSVTVSRFDGGGADNVLVGGFVYDANSTPIASGNVTAYDASTHLLTVTPGSVTPATNAGTTTTPITITSAEDNAVTGVSKTVTVHVTQGSGFTISNTSPIYFGCGNPELESVVPTAVGAVDGSGNQTITANFFHGHAAGCTVGQGGTVGVLDLVADRLSAVWKTSYFVFAAPDDSHIYEVTFLAGSRGVINSWRHNFGGGLNTITNAQITGDGSTITACNLGQLTYNFGGQYVQISGATPSSFNGTYQASAVNKNLCVTMAGTASGTATGATIAVGGAINSPDGTIPGPGGFNIWATARIRQIGTSPVTSNGITTNAYNNTILFYPNNFNFINGHVIISLDDMQAKVEPLSARGTYDVAPTPNLNRWATINVAGYGVTGDAFRTLTVSNFNPYNWYKGGGGTGQLEGTSGLSIEGPFVRNIQMPAPLQNGVGLYISNNLNFTNPNLNNSYFPIFAQGASGGVGGFTVNYDPNSGRSLIASGTGNGVNSGVTLSPTAAQINSPGTISFTAATGYKFTTLSGTGTRALTVDSTGTLGASTLGTVTSVGLVAPAWATVSGSPVTSNGNLTLNLPAFGGVGASHAPGIVPDPGTTTGQNRFLKDDGTWTDPLTGGLTTSFSITTTTGTCNFTYTKGLLTAKTGSC